MTESQKLITRLKEYHKKFDQNLLIKAYNFSKDAHSTQFRSSGEEYFSHPLSVANIIIDLKLDYYSVITALLHDTVEDTEVTLEDIENNFGKKITELVDGVTKLTKIENLTHRKKAAENFRKLVMAMSNDIRVLLVKLCDRVHNMRTIHYIKDEKRKLRIANESLNIYAPLAERIGINKIRDELNEISFSYVEPEAKSYIEGRLKELKEKKKDIIEDIVKELKEKILPDVSNAEIYGREKSVYSIWNKIKKSKLGFNHIYDIMGFRIIVNDISECYKILGIINSNYSMIPGSFKDYISTPKENNYRSLHLIILGPKNRKTEIQIRTKKMHEFSEHGLAAHWKYKQNILEDKYKEEYQWIRDLINMFERSNDASEVLRNHQLQMHQDHVFCFTPIGDIFNLPIGSTIIDFAYAIHSEIGDNCNKAKVNGNTVPLNQKLENGDQVEIITLDNSSPSPEWLQFVVTSRAKVAIRHFIRTKIHNQYLTLGKSIIDKFFYNRSLKISDMLLEKTLSFFNKKNVDELYIAVARGVISRNEILEKIYPSKKNSKIQFIPKKNIPIEGLIPGIAIHLSKCCSPIPGDDIIGVINVGSGVNVHNKECFFFKDVAIKESHKVNLSWEEEISEEKFTTNIRLTIKNKIGSLSEFSNILVKNNVNINDIRIINRGKEFFNMIVNIEIQNLPLLEKLINNLRIGNNIIKITRL